MTLGKGFGNGFPVTAMLVGERFKDKVETISASTSYGGNPMACAAALASIEVIEEEDICERAAHLGDVLLKRMREIQAKHPIVGDVRGVGCLLGIELVKDKRRRALRGGRPPGLSEGIRQGSGLDPAWHILRMSPPMIMQEDVALKRWISSKRASTKLRTSLGTPVVPRLRRGLTWRNAPSDSASSAAD